MTSEAAVSAQSWWVYMVETASGKLYTGISTDVDRRFAEHQNNKVRGAKFFRSDTAVAIVYREPCANRSEASKREAAIKKLRRSAKWQLVKEYSAKRI